MLPEVQINGANLDLAPDELALINRIAKDLGITADLCRADLLLFCKGKAHNEVICVAHARPHSSSPLYEERMVGKSFSYAEIPYMERRPNPRVVHSITVRGANVARQVFGVENDRQQLIAVLTRDAFWLAHERHRRRSAEFRRALDIFVDMVLHGKLKGGNALSPFREHDGILYVGPDLTIRYMSGICSELYRHIGYRDSLIGWRIEEIETVDSELVAQAISRGECLERQDEQFGYTWIRKAIPILARRRFLWHTSIRAFPQIRLLGQRAPMWQSYGAFVLIHDATEALRTQRELESQMALVREVHHRVKNNLQILASIMRMEARRAEHKETRTALEEGVHRILSVAVVHEYLSQNARGKINLQEVAHRILSQFERGLIHPDRQIQFSVKGPDIWLPAERATQCALVINELVQNAIEHGLADRIRGAIDIVLMDDGGQVTILVRDNGRGLPEGFDLSQNAHLGLNIVKSMVERDLRGKFELKNGAQGATAAIVIDKQIPV